MAEAGPSKSPVPSNPKSHFDSISSNSSKHVQLALGHGPPPAPPRRRTQDVENVFPTRNNRRRIRSDSLGGEEGSPSLSKPRPPMKHEMRPTYLVEADADITAFSDEYDLGECTACLAQNDCLMLFPAHEGNRIIYASLELSIPYRNARPCDSCGRTTCAENEGTERSSITGSRSNTHGCIPSLLLLGYILSKQSPRFPRGQYCVPLRQPPRRRGGFCHNITPNATFAGQWSDPRLVREGGPRGTQT